MKDIIEVELKTRKADFCKNKTDILAVGLFSDAGKLDSVNSMLNDKLDGAIQQLLKIGDFKARDRACTIIYGNEKIGAKRIMLVGLGEKKKATLDTIRKAAAVAAKKAVDLKAKTLSLALHNAFGESFDLSAIGQACTEGTYYGSYRYDEYVTESDDGRLGSLAVELIDSDANKVKKLNQGLNTGTIIGKAQSYARTIANRPGNVIYPEKIAGIAKELSRKSKNLSCTIFDDKQLKAKGMGGILAVGSGSVHKPVFIILKNKPSSKKANSVPTIGIVGKAITFDSGGLSLKPAANMDEMKLDKSGGIAILAAMKAIAEMDLPINVYGFIPSAENLPSGSSYRPGDIVTTYNGKTIEVQNTDAEGRIILSDALAYAAKQKCDIIVDMATLTGACMVALGKYMAGLMGNDDELMKQVQKASEESGEKVWPMPSGDEYAEEMKSKIADLKNIGSKWGGACTAAAFLKQFVGESKWAHLDVAGVDLISGPADYSVEGSTGFGVRLLITFLMNMANSK
ncbi:MAG: leucyl aminopeptidase [Sedimentisphaerales bacterium]|nr:leucyl aminopeptidase [Sedimentisphaerales bacterium]